MAQIVQFVRFDVFPFILREPIEENGALLCTIGDDRPIASGTSSPAPGDALLDEAAA
jgi:hypothetical protein